MDEKTAKLILELYKQATSSLNLITGWADEAQFEGAREVQDQAFRVSWQIYEIGMKPIIAKFPHLDPDREALNLPEQG